MAIIYPVQKWGGQPTTAVQWRKCPALQSLDDHSSCISYNNCYQHPHFPNRIFFSIGRRHQERENHFLIWGPTDKACVCLQEKRSKTGPAQSFVNHSAFYTTFLASDGKPNNSHTKIRNASKTTIGCGLEKSDSIQLIRCRAVSPSDLRREVHKSQLTLSGTEGGKTQADPRLLLHRHTIKQTVSVPYVWQRN